MLAFIRRDSCGHRNDERRRRIDVDVICSALASTPDCFGGSVIRIEVSTGAPLEPCDSIELVGGHRGEEFSPSVELDRHFSWRSGRSVNGREASRFSGRLTGHAWR